MARAGFFSGWRGLGRFWAVVLLLLGGGAVTLQMLGPPRASPPTQAIAATASHVAPSAPQPPAPQTSESQPPVRQTAHVAPHDQKVTPSERPGSITPGPIPDPDPALLASSPKSHTDMMPQVAPDGRKAWNVYAAGFDRGTMRARVGLVLAGIGMNEADSLTAARDLPGAVTLAVSPYAVHLDKILSAARLAGHEYLLSLPMEPTEFPLNDPGQQALLTSLPPEQNLDRLYWAMSRLAGYVGATNALATMRGERFSGMGDQMAMVLKELDHRGLIFIDARVGEKPPAGVWSRSIDMIIDDVATREAIEAKLNELARLAADKGSAVGLASVPRPITVERIAAWTNGLMGKGLILAPVTSLVSRPSEPRADK
ncbi:MAG: divergent polysaccharide deacetylase family protein [Acetobacteraceae bacterium]